MSSLRLRGLGQTYAAPGRPGRPGRRRDRPPAERPALAGVDLDVADGELLAVLGPSGSGKSTLLRLVAGLERASTGRVLLDDRDVTDLPPGRRDVSMVFQSYALFPHLTVRQNIAFGLQVRDVPARDAAARTAQAAELVGCAPLLERRPGQLSGGERQRVALARALVREPAVFLLDEPLSNVDSELRGHLRTELRALQARLGATMVHVTHDQVDALVLGDRVAVLRDGVLEQVGTPDELWAAPANRFVATFVGAPSMNLLPADGPLRLPGVAPRPGLQLGVRPDALRLAPPGAPGAPARVEHVERWGADAHVHLRADRWTVVARVPAGAVPAVGDELSLGARAEDVHLFDEATGRRVPAP